RGLQPLGVLGRIAHPDVQDDLHELRNLVRVAEAELLGELRPDPLLVVVEQARPRGGLGGRRGRPRRLARSGTLSLGLLGLLLLARRPLTLRRGSGISRGSRSRRPGPGVGGALVLGLGLFRVRHRYLTRWIGWPDLTATRSMVPSLSRRRRTRVGWPDFGSSSITFDAAIGAGNSMIPLSPWGVVARLCFFTTFTPSTTTRNCLGYTCRTLPSRPRSSPRITRTRSPLATWSLLRAGSRSVRRARRLFLNTSALRAPELSAILTIDSCWITIPPPYFARSTISTTRHRFSFDSGRVSTMRTVSPSFAPRSSWAATFLVRTICLP